MSLTKVSPGKKVPNEINVIIEIPAHGEPVKYEVDKDSGAIFVDRFMATAMHYPCNYGYIPGTLSEDGDPVDVLVVTPFALNPASVIRCRPLGVLRMSDESGQDAKVLAVPIDKLTPIYQNVNTPYDLPPLILDQITHFFEHYKDLELGKWVKVEGWGREDEAHREILDSITRYRESGEEMGF